MTKPFKAGLSVDAWALAVELLVRWLENNERVDALLDSLPRSLGRAERGRCQHLLFGAVRNLGRIESIFAPMLARPPRTAVKAVLLIAGYELIEGGNDGHTARVVHHAVEQTKTLASLPESKMVNAVVRKIAGAIEAQTEPAKMAGATEIAAYYSHPEWLVRRWLAQFGAAGARALLEWNQKPAPVYARWRAEGAPAGEDAALFAATPWKGFYEVKSGAWARVETLVNDGTLFLQDPATRHAIELLAPKAGETVLDACAAPGGKSLAIADAMGGSGRVVALDLPSPRIERLKQNLSRAKIDVALVQGDVMQVEREGVFEACNLPKAYDAVLLDVPCSNTGVMRHRVDVKWRLQISDFAKHARQQGDMLSAAARLVAPGGRLVYSTCSLDAEENDQVIKLFLEKTRGRFTLEGQRVSQPWVDGHDGAAAFLLRKAVG
ncbi:MAG: RsmB/NOP family class I SAM-dependent RNA methyltransferase [Opitutaceae bacterium]|nr:RsmB/NOP family class I SAM-dependent RNA methyltransferase [Opitutaceae bacterium]